MIRAIEKQKDIYACFIDYSKACDTVRHEPLIDLLKSIDVDSHDVQLLASLYWKQKAAVRHNVRLVDVCVSSMCASRMCIASPHLFALYTEMIIISLEDKGGFRIGGRVIDNLRYADDTEHELHHLMDIVVQESELKGLFLNIAKSYTMVFNKSSSIPTCQIKLHGKPMEQVNSFVCEK